MIFQKVVVCLFSALEEDEELSLSFCYQLDPDAIGAKAKYLVNHFVSKSADLSNAEFKAKGMLIVKGRRNIIKVRPLSSA